jgi:hypothetical protein
MERRPGEHCGEPDRRRVAGLSNYDQSSCGGAFLPLAPRCLGPQRAPDHIRQRPILSARQLLEPRTQFVVKTNAHRFQFRFVAHARTLPRPELRRNAPSASGHGKHRFACGRRRRARRCASLVGRPPVNWLLTPFLHSLSPMTLAARGRRMNLNVAIPDLIAIGYIALIFYGMYRLMQPRDGYMAAFRRHCR